MNRNLYLIAFLLTDLRPTIASTWKKVTIAQSPTRLQPQGRRVVTRHHEAWKRMEEPPIGEVQLQQFGMANVETSQKRVMRMGGWYDPNLGYEPYWHHGSVYYNYNPPLNDPEYACGLKCSPMQKLYGKICGRNKYYQYKTFDDYCSMQTTDCKGIEGWMVSHTGDCNPYSGFKNFTKFIAKKPRPYNFSNSFEVNYFNS